MLGHSHALSGLAAGAATLPGVPVHGTVAQVAWVSAVGGFAMLPDLDQRGSTISRMWGPLTDAPSGVVSAIARGHRWGTHDAVLAPAVFGLIAYAASWQRWSSLLLMALAIGLALRALHFVIPGRAENTVIGNLLLSWGGAWLLLEHSPSPGWLPLAIAAGVLTHIAGDWLTREGVPVPVFWLVRRSRLAPVHLRTGAVVEKAVLVPLFAVATVVLLYRNTGARDLVDPLLAQLG
ncbi:metal-dependent hydrolase [uncultured Modestobacter sp.]|uniref:metal-dependent hydrolase n=1 Tax=uncultured Modestobacter sp. TaxID=380048 RepID=UPI0026303BD5|nr:metal-dependent hydrolase [uncultured Modestobacter sp.]